AASGISSKKRAAAPLAGPAASAISSKGEGGGPLPGRPLPRVLGRVVLIVSANRTQAETPAGPSRPVSRPPPSPAHRRAGGCGGRRTAVLRTQGAARVRTRVLRTGRTDRWRSAA